MFRSCPTIPRVFFVLAAASWPLAAFAQTPAPAPTKPPTFTFEMSNDFSNPGRKEKDQDEVDLLLTKQASLRSTYSVGVNYHNRWADTDVAVIVGAGHAFGGRKHLFLMSGTLGVSAGADSIPLRDYKVNGEYRFNEFANPVGVFERQAFPNSVEVNTVTAGAKITPIKGKKTYIQPVFIHTWAFINPRFTENGNAFGMDGSIELDKRVDFIFKGGYGHEHAMARQLTVVEVVESLKQLTIESGFSIKLNAERGLKASYTYEDKKGKYKQHGFVVGGFVMF